MRKHLVSVFGLLLSGSMSATQYMHINLPNGKEYDIKIEKTDNVSHIKDGDEVLLKVTRTDDSYSLYPLSGAEVTFDEAITRMPGDVKDWSSKAKTIEGCVFDTTRVHEYKEMNFEDESINYALFEAQEAYGRCIEQKKKELGIKFDSTELNLQCSANKYATDLFARILNGADFKDKNTIFSPTSLQFALAMLANGADDDDAYSELTEALGKSDMPVDILNSLYKKRMTNLTLTNPLKVQIGVANATFLQNDMTFGKNFLQNMEEFYNAISNNVDFTQDSTIALIDKWANENTNGMIPKIGIQPSNLLNMVLANALSFQSEWEDKFYKEATKPGEFTTSKGEKINVDKMNRSYWGEYAEGENYQLTTLRFYEGYVMNVILPNEGVSPESVLANLDIDNINYKYGEVNEEGIDIMYAPNLSLPKFSADTKIKLNESLKEMGLDKTFSASFNNIAEATFVDKIQQLAHLEIDEDGAKGAAVTTVEMVGCPLYDIRKIDFDVNRPFIVTINNPSTHDLLFIGVINDPTSKE